MGCNKSKNAEPTTGEVSPTTTANDQVKALTGKLKAEVEKEYGKELNTFEAVSFRRQAVAANVYFIKVNVGEDEYIHLRVYDAIPKESDKAAAGSSSEQGTQSPEKKGDDSSEEKGESSAENGEGSEEKNEEKSAETQTTEEKTTAKLEGLQRGKKLDDDIAEFETTEEEPSLVEEVILQVPDVPKEEPKEEEPKEEEPKEEEPKEEEPKEEEGDSSLLSMVKDGASDVAGGLGF